ncbi:MAG: magnesium protoporphyrin IX methyltransferase [Spirulinaceae cyanobacterium SM2_1_0]|nr:magnesium protoporphyrin IX methyltransferase [Spirulinaceae cyanobacterium SM2_1_0]
MTALDDKTIVRDYFNAKGFDRWRRIYGDGEVNKVQLDIRQGHQQTVDRVLNWLEADGNLANLTICDAGCGVGSLSLPLAAAGAQVYGSDISEKMVGEAQARAQQTLTNPDLKLEVKDLEDLSGSYHTVICLDVLIHYPDAEAFAMLAQLASLAESRLLVSFAPKTFGLSLLKKVGEFFPGPSKATRAYLHRVDAAIKVLIDQGFAIERTGMTSTRFYFSQLLEAVRL